MLADVPLARRVVISAIVVITILLLLAALGYFSGGWEDDPPPITMRFNLASAESIPEFCIVDEETRERIRNIMVDALDEALHDQIKSLFQVWMKDERGQPDRARVGARQAIRAHQAARKNAVEWMPPICSG